MRCAPRTVELEIERLSMVKRFFGDCRLDADTPAVIRRYQQLVSCRSWLAGQSITSLRIADAATRKIGKWNDLCGACAPSAVSAETTGAKSIHSAAQILRKECQAQHRWCLSGTPIAALVNHVVPLTSHLTDSLLRALLYEVLVF